MLGPGVGQDQRVGHVVRVVVLGMPCLESSAAVQAMQEAGIEIATIILARATAASGLPEAGLSASGGELPAFGRRGAPIVAVSQLRPDAVGAIRQARPDVIVTACFPWRLPPTVLDLPPLGCLNIHPSLLPRGRGPAPVFWTYRRGERETGVTVHQMDAGLDTGPILAQRRVEVSVGSRAPELERALMAKGGQLAATLLPALARGALTPEPQDAALATYAPVPGPGDYEIATTWLAEHAFAFAAGVAPLNGPLAVQVAATGERIPVRDAVDYAAEAPMTGNVVDEGRGLVRVRFGPGWVRFLRADADRYKLSLSPIRARDIR